MSAPVRPEDVASILEIQALKADYFRCIDSKDWTGLVALFTLDATLFYTEAQDEPVGIADSLEFIASGMEGCTSIHHGHMPSIEILSPTSARGVWAMEDRLFWPEGRPSRLGLRTLHGFGHYYEDYARPAERWLIRTLKLVRIHATAVPAGGPAPAWADTDWTDRNGNDALGGNITNAGATGGTA